MQIGEQVYDMGVVDDVNMLASAYGKRNIDALLGENGQNIIYTKENKSINQLLDNRLQLPELVADDTLVAYSIRRNAGNSNTSSENVPLSEMMQYGKTPEQAAMEPVRRYNAERRQQMEMQAAGHIDELAETARWSKFAPDRNGKHANDIGEDGFDTFTTYFEDSDGQYYRVRFTAGVNEDMDTAYSIGMMQKRRYPSSNGSSDSPFGSGAHGTHKVSSDNSITPDGANGNASVQNTFGFTPEQIAKGTVPLSEAMQYGKTPEQAAMEARARADGERMQQQCAEVQAAETQTLIDAWNAARPIRSQIEDMRSKMNLTENDECVLQGSLLPGDTNAILKNANDPTAVLQWLRAFFNL